MHGAHEFLKALAMVLCVAGITTVLFQRLRQPVVLGYILAGLIIGPHVPIPLVADPEIVRTLSELGVILLMFSLGLEFSIRKLVAVGPTAGVTAVIQSGLMIWFGYLCGRAFGWTVVESIFTGAIIAISSTTIIAKAFDEQNIRGKLRELVVGILIVEDLIAILLMAALTAIATGSGLSAGALFVTVGKLAAFLAGLLVVGMLVVPRAVRAIARLNRPETTLVSTIGICFASALLAHEFGYSVALGAFIAGSLVAESGEETMVEHLVMPVRDLFAAIFFVSVGMLIDPALIAEHWFAVATLTAVVVAGKVVGVSFGAFLTGTGVRTSVQAGMSLAQIGEFSFIIATLGLTLRSTREFLYPVAVAVSAITTLTTPFLIRSAGPVASFVDRKLPRPVQTYAALYGSWLDRMRASRGGRPIRRLFLLAVGDVALLASIIIGASLFLEPMAIEIEDRFGLSEEVARWLGVAGAIAAAVPFLFGLIRLSRRLGIALAERALPSLGADRVDLAAAPRRALIVTLQLGTLLLLGVPLIALTQPFMPPYVVAVAFAAVLAMTAVAFWRSATNLQGHVRAGAEVLVEALARQSKTRPEPLNALVPGLGEPVPITIGGDALAVGKSLAQLNVRGKTGATVLAIQREGAHVLLPAATEVLRAGDVLAVAGSRDAIEAVKLLLDERAVETDRGR